MKLLTAIAISIAVGAASAAAMTRYVAAHAASVAFWQHDPVAALWLALGGPAPLAVVMFACTSFVCVTLGAAIDLGSARARLERAGLDRNPAPNRSAIFTGTAFATIGDQLVADDFHVAPLWLLRALRTEIWRVYARRLAAVELLAIATGAGLVLLWPGWISTPAIAGAGPLATALLVLAAIAALWLVLDGSIARLSAAMTAASAAWLPVGTQPEPSPHPLWHDQSLARHEELLAMVDRLVCTLAATPEPSLRMAEELTLARSEMRALIERADRTLPPAEPAERAVPFPEEAVANLTAALSDVARAVRKLSAENAAERWEALETAVRAMSATLDGVAESVRLKAKVARPRTITDEIDDLLDELADTIPSGPHHPPPIKSP